KGPQFSSLLFNGAQGQINNVDVKDPHQPSGHKQARRVAETLAGEVMRVIGTMKLSSEVELAAAVAPVTLKRKTVTDQDLAIARQILAGGGDEYTAPFSWVVGQPIPQGLRAVYAAE